MANATNSFFGLQVMVLSPQGDPWRERLMAVLRRNQGDQDVVQKRALYTALTHVLAEVPDRWAFGVWDLIRGPRATREFDEWVAGVEGAIEEPIDPSWRHGDCVAVTIVLLVEEGSPADDTLGARCDLPERDWFTRRTFARLISTLRMLQFAHIRADGLYAMPGDPAAGIPLAELRGEGWEYLKPLTGDVAAG